MNRIIISNNQFDLKNIEYKYKEDIINKLKLIVIKNTKLELIIDKEIKLDVNVELLDNVKLDLVVIKKNKTKILTKYKLNENSILNITEISDSNIINERNIIDLNGINSKVNFILKTVCKNNEKYDVVVNHNNKNTTSDIITNGVNISGNLYFTVTSYVLNGNKNCVVNQQNRIINLTDKECLIRPNLLIDEVDTIANHSALIGSFKDEELFYMQRLGIDKETANKLLIEGFIKNKLNKTLANYFKKYWR